jgi:hypothetical protein
VGCLIALSYSNILGRKAKSLGDKVSWEKSLFTIEMVGVLNRFLYLNILGSEEEFHPSS